MFSALLIAGVLLGSNQLAQSFEFEEETIYINKKNRWLGGCKPKIDFFCDTTGSLDFFELIFT